MTNEEAINVLEDYDINFERHTAEAIAEAHEMAIKALEQQSCEDWNAVLDELIRIGRNAFKDDTDYDNLFNFISNLPNVTPQPKEEPQQKTGHWLSQSEYCKMNNLIPSGLGCYFWCSECNCGIDYKYFHLVDYNYCPKCGAKMQEVQK